MTTNETNIITRMKLLCPIIKEYYTSVEDDANIIILYNANADYGEKAMAKTILDILRGIQTIDPASYSLGSLSQNKVDALDKVILYWTTQVYGSLNTIRMVRNTRVE
jgi:hypothetical protein